MSVPKVLVILGHPRRDSLNGALAEAWTEGARGARVDVELIHLGELDFDLHVRHSSPRTQPFEADLARCRHVIEEAEHIVFVFPTWWASMPALLKGFLDRILLPGFAFEEDEASPTGYRGLLKGRTAELVTTMDTPGWVYRLIYGRPGVRAMRTGTLGFCGIKVIRTTRVCEVKTLTDAGIAGKIETVRRLGSGYPEERRRRAKRERWFAWVKVVRLHFYAMTLLAYGLGGLAAVRWGDGVFGWPVFIAGFVGLFLLEMTSVLQNELHDREADEGNRNAGPFSGGSRAIVDGPLEPRSVALVSRGLLVLALAVLLGVLLSGGPLSAPAWLLVAVGVILGWGYTTPPLKLVYRGVGEWVVAFTHSAFMLVCGWIFVGGAPNAGLPWLLSLPMGLAVLAAITLAGIPDRTSDAAAGKLTLAAATSNRGAAWFALVAAVLAVAVIRWLPPVIALLFESVWPAMMAHLLLLLIALVRFLRKGAPCQRIDGILFLALSYILWFSAVPLVRLW